jgi:SprT protein
MQSAPRKQSPFKQLEFCFELVPHFAIPSDAELRSRAVNLLRETGASELAARLRVEWNSRMRTAVGRAEPSRTLIALNPALQNFGVEEIERTLRHELAHLLAQHRAGHRRILPHGREWRRACRDLGIANERACHKLPLTARELARRYLYRCRNCQRDFSRVHRIRRALACLACCRRFARGRYDERFRLRLVRIKPNLRTQAMAC